jgi:hypothetical protein
MRRANWRSGRNVACFVWLKVCLVANLCGALLAAAQTTGPAQEPAPASKFRPLSLKEERAIVKAAWEHTTSEGGIRDCSHIVQQIYSAAGYDYPYASSFELYRGTEHFIRVKNPQPGDLIAWPGHVGIVLNAKQHSFYSLVSTGFEAQDYRGAYWRGRGRPRFYRYIMERSTSRDAVRTARATRASEERPELTTASVIEKEIDKDSGSTGSARRYEMTDASQRVALDPAPTPPVTSQPVTTVPASIAIATANARPTSPEVSEGISALTNAAAENLNTKQPLKVTTPVVIFEQLTVERVEIKRNHGWAHLKIDSHVAISGDGADFKTRHDKVRWELRRSESGWEALPPSDRVYVPRDAAVRILAAHLARLTQSDAATEHNEAILGQEARIANLLSALLEHR